MTSIADSFRASRRAAVLRGPSPWPRRAKAPIAALLLFAFAACSVGPDYASPQITLPGGFHESAASFSNEAPQLAAWWRSLEDPLLDELVARVQRQNLGIAEAAARVEEARALRGAAAAEFAPQVDAEAGYRRFRDSENTGLGPFARETDTYSAGIAASWEVDLWGRVRRLVEAADAEIGRESALLRDVLTSVIAETAASYVQLRALEVRFAIAQQNLELQRRTLGLVETRFESGLVGERDVAQARSNLASTQARLPALEAARRAMENRLAVLLGQAPGALAAELATPRPLPSPPQQVAVGVPADVVRQRPDVRAAERALAAETARIGILEAELYPRLTLFGDIGVMAEDAGDLGDASSGFFSFGPSLSWNLFDAGRVRRRIDAQDARVEQALHRWEHTVLRALEEVENAMTGLVRERERRTHLAAAAEQARRAVELAQTQYREGLTDFQNVLDSERVTAALEDELAASDAAIAGEWIALHRALGGGWQVE